jgi:hypothetical protein
VTVGTKNETRGPGPPPAAALIDADRADSEEVVRSGDEHGHGAESLCVGESQ